MIKRPALALRRRWHRRVGMRRAQAALGGRLEIDRIVVDTPNRFVARARHGQDMVYVKFRRPAGSLRREADAHAAATALGLPAARSIAYLPGTPEVLITGAVDGRPLHAADDGEAWTIAGAALRRFHDPDGYDRVRPFEDDVDWVAGFRRRAESRRTRAVAIAGASGPIVEAAARRALTDIENVDLTTRRTIIHGDCQAAHVLVAAGTATFVDLDLCGGGDPWYDLAVLGSYAGERREALIRGYDPSLLTDPAFATADHAYATVRFVSAIVWRAEHGFDPQEFVARLCDHAAGGA